MVIRIKGTLRLLRLARARDPIAVLLVYAYLFPRYVLDECSSDTTLVIPALSPLGYITY